MKLKLKDEGPKSTRTRFVGIITSTIHPYICFFFFYCRAPVDVGEICYPLMGRIISFDCRITVQLVYSCTYSKSKRRDV